MPVSTGNKGVDQLDLNFFSKCGIALILFPIFLAMFSMTGCLEKADGPAQVSSPASSGQMENSSLQMDFDVELKENLFAVRGSLVLPGDVSLPYLFLNATLEQENRSKLVALYMLMQLEPGRDYSFEICKNARIAPGEYDCVLKAEGPNGLMAEESRKVSLQTSQQLQVSQTESSWSSIEEAAFWQRWEEENSKAGHARAESAKASAEEKSSQISKNDSTVAKDGVPEGNDSSLLSHGNAGVVGSVTAKKYHRPDCRFAKRIKPENLVYFKSSEEAESQGYVACKVCNP